MRERARVSPKLAGIAALLAVIAVATALGNPRFLLEVNLENLIRRTALFGVLAVGEAFVIIIGGVDLSIGSIVSLVGCLLPFLIVEHHVPPALAVLLLLVLSAVLGLLHGLFVTKLRLQPFVVTLCGLLLYRGLARGITRDQTQGFGTGGYDALRSLAVGRPFSVPVPFLRWASEGGLSPYRTDPLTGARERLDFIAWIAIPAPFVVLLGVAILSSIFLRRTVFGRYLYAVGQNMEAARYSGIATDRVIIIAYVLCALLAGLGSVLFILEVNSAQPVDFGNFYELYAIAAAVLGGCSLRGGEGMILGVVLGAALMQVLRNAINLLGVPTQLEFAVIGAVILAGVSIDELLRRYAARARAR